MTLKLSDLTARKRTIAEHVADGLTYEAIALRLQSMRSYRGGTITRRTVQMHVVAIADKLGEDGVPPRVRVMLWVRGQRQVAA